jgi:hypothetical protein
MKPNPTLEMITHTWGQDVVLFYFSDGIRLGWRRGAPKSAIGRYATVRFPELDAIDITPHIAVARAHLPNYGEEVPR